MFGNNNSYGDLRWFFFFFLVCRFELYGVPGAQQNGVHDFHGVGADLVAQHVNRHDGQHLRSRDWTKREGMDETGGNVTETASYYNFVKLSNETILCNGLGKNFTAIF